MKRPLLVLSAVSLLALPPAAHGTGTASPDTLGRVVPMPPVEVSTTRMGPFAPVASTSLGVVAIRRTNWGQDTPMALGALPGAYAYSDAGNGIGYSYLAVRAFPQRRISVMVDGVPLNDPESHEVWWIDHPDLLASTRALQLQRGVGPALYGAAALGGSVDLQLGPPDDDAHASAELTGGSFGTRRAVFDGSSGLLPSGWRLYGRYSRIETDGYREQSWSRLWSYALGARRQMERQAWTVNLFGGPENTHLAYLGVAPDYLAGRVTGSADRDRRFNPIAYPGEQDHFFEPHYELLHTWAPRAGTTISQTFFWFDGSGYYDEQRAGQDLSAYRLAPWATTDSTRYAASYYERDSLGHFVRDAQGRAIVARADLVRRREVTNRHFGWVPRARLEHARGAFTLGGELRAHDGRHVGSVISGDALPPGTVPDARYYDYHPRTLAAGLFAREEWDARPTLRVTADLAWRHQRYAVRDDRFDGVRFDQSYDFANPRLGLTWHRPGPWSAFVSYAYAGREPALRDLYDGEGTGSVPLYRVVDRARGVYSDPLIHPEHVHDVELGARWERGSSAASVNLYRMDFRDELVYAGQFNTDLGYPVLGNAARSVHQGAELAGSAGWAMGRVHAALEGNLTLSDNHFVEYTEHYGPTAADDVRYDDEPIGFFPATMANVGARVALRDVSFGLDAQYAGRIYVDNTGTKANSIDPRVVTSARLVARRALGASTVELSLRVLNLADARYATGGYMDYDRAGDLVPTLTPAATRNWLAGVRAAW
jgi:iron complex outermembrane receptor protein